MTERVLRSRTQPTVLIVGAYAARIRHYLMAMLPDQVAWNLDAVPIDPQELTYLRAQVLVVTDVPAELRGKLRRLMRCLPDRRGLFVGYGRDAEVRKATRGFHLTYRWFDEASYWVGAARASDPLAFTAAARVAHELGVSSKEIRASVSA